MSYKFALTSTGPYSGKTTLAKYLEKEHGFIIASHSRSLIELFVEFWNNTHDCGMEITVEEVYAEKEDWRPALQEFGDASGFNQGAGAVRFIKYTLREWLDDPSRDVVYDPFRGEVQAQVLRDMGFELIQLHISEDVRSERAESLGMDMHAVVRSMVSRPDLELGIAEPDISLNAELPVEVLAKVLLDRPVKFKGYEIYGCEVRSRYH